MDKYCWCDVSRSEQGTVPGPTVYKSIYDASLSLKELEYYEKKRTDWTEVTDI